MIPYSRQLIDEDDIAAVVDVLRGDWITQGPAVDRFETAVAQKVEAAHAVAFANGTMALFAAMFAAEVGPGDIVATSPLSFVASANCGRFVGADVQFVDIDPRTLNLDPTAVSPRVDALVAVHFSGLPVDLSLLANRPRVVIEDAAHALGARTPQGPVGNCASSDMCMFSFHPVKSITSGEGGIVTTNSSELATRLLRFRNHGIERRPDIAPWFYDVVEVAHNARMTDLQAALGASQLGKLDRFIGRRNELADRYESALADTSIELPPAQPDGWTHARHLFPIRLRERRALFDHLLEHGVRSQVHYVPIHWHTAYQAMGHARGDFPNAERAYERILSIPLHPGLTGAEQQFVIDLILEHLSR